MTVAPPSLVYTPSAPTSLNVMVVLKEMFKHAVQWGYLDTNPAQ